MLQIYRLIFFATNNNSTLQTLPRSSIWSLPLPSNANTSRSLGSVCNTSSQTLLWCTACSTVNVQRRNTSMYLRRYHPFFSKFTACHINNSHLYKKYGLGTTTYSSLAGGLLTGKVKSFFFSRSITFCLLCFFSITTEFQKTLASLIMQTSSSPISKTWNLLKARNRSVKSKS